MAGTIESALVSILAANSDVKALVADRVYPLRLDQGAPLPAITYQQVSGVRDHVFSGPSGMVKARFQVNCWAATHLGCRLLADAVRKALDGYSGTASSMVVQGIFLDSENDLPDLTPGIEERDKYGKYLDFLICFKESTT